jgi:hypothetical protein
MSPRTCFSQTDVCLSDFSVSAMEGEEHQDMSAEGTNFEQRARRPVRPIIRSLRVRFRGAYQDMLVEDIIFEERGRRLVRTVIDR